MMTAQEFTSLFINGEWANRNVVVRIKGLSAEVIDFGARTATSVYGSTRTELKSNLRKELRRRNLLPGKGRPQTVFPKNETWRKQQFDGCFEQRSIKSPRV